MASMLPLGCSARAVFSFEDRGSERNVDAGSVFWISLPPGDQWARPRLDSRILEFISHRVDEPGGRHLFEFRADRVGETEVRIPADSGRISERDYVLRVRVTEPMMPFVAR